MITLEEAEKIAGQEIANTIKRSEQLKRYKFDGVRLMSDYGFVWHFASSSEELYNEGYVPGRISALIGKDGRIWSDDEFEAYLLDEQMRQAA